MKWIGRREQETNEAAGMSEDEGDIYDNCERKSQVFVITRICWYPSV